MIITQCFNITVAILNANYKMALYGKRIATFYCNTAMFESKIAIFLDTKAQFQNKVAYLSNVLTSNQYFRVK